MYLIAEIGFNHEGDMGMARKMIQAAKDAGANAVKFQTFKADDIALQSSPHYNLIKKGELSKEDHALLFQTAKDLGIDFLSTPFSISGVELLNDIGVSAFKVASMDCTNQLLLKSIAHTKKPVFLSTGMTDLPEIAESVRFLNTHGCQDLSILHCISHYPATASELNLSIIPYLKKLFNIPVGYSDHYPGIDACFAAVILGAEIVETHFTLDKTSLNGDHSHSADPDDLKLLKEKIQLYAEMKGQPESIYHRPDKSCAKDFRRGVYASRPLQPGHVLSELDLKCTRPEANFTPNDVSHLIGRRVVRLMQEGHPISLNDIS